ncbi:MAG: hypothetical protein HY735_26785 [Verrucomicrobia bacterium]|nr:hypothetical protein [Verrucomicrobiota bacterium]
MVLAASLLVFATSNTCAADSPLDIGSRRELFVDDALVEKLTGKAELRLHHPVPQEIAIVHDAPWEGSGSGYHSIFKDGEIYRMYYAAYQLSATPAESKIRTRPLLCCYAESKDGIHWIKPELGLHEFRGSKANNIVFVSEKVGNVMSEPGEPAVFKDENPNALLDARYKALMPDKPQPLGHPRVLFAFKSPDGLHWSPMSESPVITEGGLFDSQNLACWDATRGEYRAWWRISPGGLRSIRTATSKDFLHWENQANLTYVDSPAEQLYTSQVKPYYRAPHIFVGFPTRYIDRGWCDSMRALPEREHREGRTKASEGKEHGRWGTVLTEGLFMASRDGVKFKRWNEAFLRPGIERDGTWAYGDHYIGWHLLETKSAFEGAPNELSFYVTESYWTGNSDVTRRYTLRLDGFVSANAPMSGGELVTKPLRFHGRYLSINFATSAAGSVRIEIQDMDGKALPGFALEDCPPLFGDTIERTVTWKNGSDIGANAGSPVRLRIVLQDADMYAFQFVE